VTPLEFHRNFDIIRLESWAIVRHCFHTIPALTDWQTDTMAAYTALAQSRAAKSNEYKRHTLRCRHIRRQPGTINIILYLFENVTNIMCNVFYSNSVFRHLRRPEVVAMAEVSPIDSIVGLSPLAVLIHKFTNSVWVETAFDMCESGSLLCRLWSCRVQQLQQLQFAAGFRLANTEYIACST